MTLGPPLATASDPSPLTSSSSSPCNAPFEPHIFLCLHLRFPSSRQHPSSLSSATESSSPPLLLAQEDQASPSPLPPRPDATNLRQKKPRPSRRLRILVPSTCAS
ncbi:hypothetical protein VIGAN_01215400 [Vigna angularis var. angularis]|uniref:Uncharacterized protein n=1 Tax=Vigna angularis var. angularis TaxID=157739 RepID=A0A0S3R1M1_PHAAN|nr:hypothetical protein VIGAN_01215400 [Vigna angularis var. angularis]